MLLDDLGGLEQHVLGDGEPEGLGRLEVDDEVELAGLLDGQVSRLGPAEYLHDVAGGVPVQRDKIRSVRHEPAQPDRLRILAHHRQVTERSQFDNLRER